MQVDTLIIGSGIAATALAQRLLDKNRNASILLLEAGSHVMTRDSALWENYLVTGNLPYDQFKDLNYPQKDKPGENANIGGTEVPLAGSRVITVGGSTIHWGGWSFRLKPEDFKLRTNTGFGIDWPISYSDLESYYGEAEHYIGISGDSDDPSVPRSRKYPFSPFPFSLQDQPVARALEALNIPYGNVPIARYGVGENNQNQVPCQTTGTCKYCPFGSRFNATDRLSDMISSNEYQNFNIISGAVVEEIVITSKSQIGGVIYLDKASGKLIQVDAQRVVIAAGSIESAKLLLRSTSPDWKKGLGNDSDIVGRNLVTHPYFIFTGTIKENPLQLQPEMNFPTLCTRHFDSSAEQGAGKFILVNPADTVPVKLASQMHSGMMRDGLNSYVSGPNQVQLHGMIEVFGELHNRVTNFPSRNHLGMFETSVDFTKDSNFDIRMGQIQEHVDKIFQNMGAQIVGKPSISWRADHAASVCRMSNDPASGVLDKNLQVFGLDNLFVCSNAAFSSIGAVNPTLTLTALAIRLGDDLANE